MFLQKRLELILRVMTCSNLLTMVAYLLQDAEVNGYSTTQTNPVWGLDRIDARSNTKDNAFTYEFDGSDVDIYVLDTGVQPHVDYNDRFQGCFDYTEEGMFTIIPQFVSFRLWADFFAWCICSCT